MPRCRCYQNRSDAEHERHDPRDLEVPKHRTRPHDRQDQRFERKRLAEAKTVEVHDRRETRGEHRALPKRSAHEAFELAPIRALDGDCGSDEGEKRQIDPSETEREAAADVGEGIVGPEKREPPENAEGDRRTRRLSPRSVGLPELNQDPVRGDEGYRFQRKQRRKTEPPCVDDVEHYDRPKCDLPEDRAENGERGVAPHQPIENECANGDYKKRGVARTEVTVPRPRGKGKCIRREHERADAAHEKQQTYDARFRRRSIRAPKAPQRAIDYGQSERVDRVARGELVLRPVGRLESGKRKQRKLTQDHARPRSRERATQQAVDRHRASEKHHEHQVASTETKRPRVAREIERVGHPQGREHSSPQKPEGHGQTFPRACRAGTHTAADERDHGNEHGLAREHRDEIEMMDLRRRRGDQQRRGPKGIRKTLEKCPRRTPDKDEVRQAIRGARAEGNPRECRRVTGEHAVHVDPEYRTVCNGARAP